MPLSRDHYMGLVQGQHLIKAASESNVDRRAAVAAFIDVWDTHLAGHFDDEERLLGPLADEARLARLLEEHHRLRAMADEARQQRRTVDPDAQWVREVGQALLDHIRWEERELFASIQSTRSAELDALREEAERIEASRPRSIERDQGTCSDSQIDPHA